MTTQNFCPQENYNSWKKIAKCWKFLLHGRKKMPSVRNLSFVEEKWKVFKISPSSKKKIIVLEVCPSWKTEKGLSAGNFSPRP